MATVTASRTGRAQARGTGARPQRAPLRPVRVGLFYLVLALVAAIFLAPYVFSVFAAFKPLSRILAERPWVPPTHPTLSNFTTVLKSNDFLRYVGNTAMVTIILTVGQVTFSLLAAYAFARMDFPGRELLFYVYIATLMVPNVVTMIPLYVIMDRLGLLNTYWAIFLPYVLGTPYAIFLMRQFFMTLPEEMIEAARLDGASEMRILTSIVIPVSRPIIMTAGIIAFVFGWNNFLWPLIATNSASLSVITVGIARFSSNFGIQWNLVLAASLVGLIPMLLLFITFQKQIVNSIQLTGVNR